MAINVQELLSSSLVRYGVIPVCGALFTIFAKREARHKSLTKEDLAVGIQLMVTAILMYFLLLAESAGIIVELGKQGKDISTHTNQLTFAILILALFIIGLWGVTSFVRNFGWSGKDQSGELRTFRGLVIPLLMGIFYLYAALVGITI